MKDRRKIFNLKLSTHLKLEGLQKKNNNNNQDL